MKFSMRIGKEPEDAASVEDRRGAESGNGDAGERLNRAVQLAAQAGKTAAQAGKAVHNAGKAVRKARKSASRMASDASYVVRHAPASAEKTAASLRKDAVSAWKARKLDYLERREKARRTVLARERAKARKKAKAQARTLADVRAKGREKAKAQAQAMADYRSKARAKDREKTRALWEERSYRLPSLSFIPAVLYTVLALWNLTNGSRKKSWIYHITGMLTLFIAGMYFFQDFAVRRTDDI